MGSYCKTYENDIFFFLPMTSSKQAETMHALLKDKQNRLFSKNEEREDPTFGEFYCDTLTNHCLYECNNRVFKQLKRIHLGRFSLACYDDNYENLDEPLDTEVVDLFVTAHYHTGIYVVSLVCADNHYIPTQLIDQMSTDHLYIKDPESGEYVNVTTYMQKRYFLSKCGEAKCVVCMSNHPEDRTELGYMLAGETWVSEHIDYKILPHRIDALLENHACYDYYDSYLSRSVVAFVFKDYPESFLERLETEASEIFIVEIVLFQNTAVTRTNNRVIEELNENDGISNEEIEELYVEFGHTMKFWSSNVFKYTFAQKEADELIEAFEIKKTLDEYYRNQDFLDRMVELKGNIADEESGEKMNTLLFFLSGFEGCSITLAGVLWVLQRTIPETAPGYNIIENIVSVLWIFAFFGICWLFLTLTSGKFLARKKQKKLIKEKKKQPKFNQ
ncbi:MAG: hypothetical protein IJV96_06250 [Clostridia bacterium]|nr:hypothetical protein [Clostridia bacterium]